MYSAVCAMLTTRATPKISEKPMASKAYMLPLISPLITISWIIYRLRGSIENYRINVNLRFIAIHKIVISRPKRNNKKGRCGAFCPAVYLVTKKTIH